MKKFLAMALALLMVCVMLPVVAMADDVDTELPASVDGVITLQKNVVLSSAATINYTSGIQASVLDLNGHTITRANGLTLDIYGTLTIKDSVGGGKIVSSDIRDNVKGSSNAIWVNDNTNVTLESGTLDGKDFGAAVQGANAKFTVNGGVVKGISGNGNQTTDGTTITITGGEVSDDDIAIYHPQNGTLNITGGTISGATAIYIKSGTVNISGTAVIKGTGTKADAVPNGNGANPTGDAIIMDSKAGYYGNMKLNIGSGATITSANGYALQVANTDITDATNVVELNITGGTLRGATDAVKLSEQFVTAVETEGNNVSATVTGGTFNGNTDVIKKFIPADSNLEIKNGTVQPKSSNITIIVPSEGGSTTTTPSTDTTKNPSTGANDFVGVAAAAAVMALLGSAVVLRKK